MKKLTVATAAGVTSLLMVVPAAGPAAAATAKPVNTVDKAFLQAAAATDLAEISLAKVALAKATTSESKRYAARMIKDHTMMLRDARIIANATGVTLPTAPLPAQVAVAKAVSAKSGVAFDVAYLASQVAGHTLAVANATVEIKKGSYKRIKGHAIDGTPMIRYHLWLAKQYLGWAKKA
jgi:putative membrane protein